MGLCFTSSLSSSNAVKLDEGEYRELVSCVNESSISLLSFVLVGIVASNDDRPDTSVGMLPQIVKS